MCKVGLEPLASNFTANGRLDLSILRTPVDEWWVL